MEMARPSANMHGPRGQTLPLLYLARPAYSLAEEPKRMVSASTKMQDATSTQNEPPAYVTEGATQGFLEGVYTLTNKKIRKLLTVSYGAL